MAYLKISIMCSTNKDIPQYQAKLTQQDTFEHLYYLYMISKRIESHGQTNRVKIEVDHFDAFVVPKTEVISSGEWKTRAIAKDKAKFEETDLEVEKSVGERSLQEILGVRDCLYCEEVCSPEKHVLLDLLQLWFIPKPWLWYGPNHLISLPMMVAPKTMVSFLLDVEKKAVFVAHNRNQKWRKPKRCPGNFDIMFDYKYRSPTCWELELPKIYETCKRENKLPNMGNNFHYVIQLVPIFDWCHVSTHWCGFSGKKETGTSSILEEKCEEECDRSHIKIAQTNKLIRLIKRISGNVFLFQEQKLL